MNEKLQKTIQCVGKQATRRFKIGKPFWCNVLTEMWTELGKAEREIRECKCRSQMNDKIRIFKSKQDAFD